METKVSNKEFKPSLKPGFTTEELAAVVSRDAITTLEVAEILCIEKNSVYRIPFQDLPYIMVNQKRRLYSRRLVVEYLAKRHKRFMSREQAGMAA